MPPFTIYLFSLSPSLQPIPPPSLSPSLFSFAVPVAACAISQAVPIIQMYIPTSHIIYIHNLQLTYTNKY